MFYNKADYGCAVVMEVETGKIRAIANLLIDTATGEYSEARNYAVADAEEPGSTIKLASFMAALEKEQFDLDDKKINVKRGRYQVYDRKVKDSHGYNKNTVFSAREVFEKSSNVGTVKLVEEYYKENPVEYVERLYSFGLCEKLGLDIIGEAFPKIKTPSDKDWYGTSLQWMCHGYETQITPLQILSYYNAVANNGKLIKPIFIEKIIAENKEETIFQPAVIKKSICSQETVGKLKELLNGVVENGTAKRPFRGSLYKVAGKTGTSQVFTIKQDEEYDAESIPERLRDHSLYIGFAPAQNPKIALAIVVENGGFGAKSAAPIARKIFDFVISHKRIK